MFHPSSLPNVIIPQSVSSLNLGVVFPAIDHSFVVFISLCYIFELCLYLDVEYTFCQAVVVENWNIKQTKNSDSFGF